MSTSLMTRRVFLGGTAAVALLAPRPSPKPKPSRSPSPSPSPSLPPGADVYSAAYPAVYGG